VCFVDSCGMAMSDSNDKAWNMVIVQMETNRQMYLRLLLMYLPVSSSVTKRLVECLLRQTIAKAVPLHAMEALGGRVSIAPSHSRPRH
jgi:hypothetical protein